MCEIKWAPQRGMGEFQAVVSVRDGRRLVVARSPRFRWRVPLLAPDASPRVAAAHDALVRELVRAGWQPCGGGLLKWYAQRFQAPETFAVSPAREADG